MESQMRRMKAIGNSSAGFTLLELLLVVFIVSALAFVTTSAVQHRDEQERFDATVARLAAIRRGILGSDEIFPAGARPVAGFVADMGRLPDTLSELLEPGLLPLWSYRSDWGVWSGWRGPYVAGDLEIENETGFRVFRDGWGNREPADSLGWGRFETDPVSGGLLVQSFGSDGAQGGIGYAADYPPSGFLVESADYMVDLRGLHVQITASTSTAGGRSLRLALESGGNLNGPWPSSNALRDATSWLSEARHLPLGQPQLIEFRFESPPSGPFLPKEVPWGRRVLLLVDDDTGDVVQGSQPIPLTLYPRTALPELAAREWTLL